jgi:tRNA modification GTPase
MQHYHIDSTITAIATPPGEGAISIIRISGQETLTIVNEIYSKDLKTSISHRAYNGNILDDNGDIIDSVLLLFMKNPKSYTGEDLIEIHCHGGNIITRKIFNLILSKGARAALPGEFTYRAFLNKKVDLAQAEAIQELISAKNELALFHAEKQLSGTLSEKIKSYQSNLTDISAIIEAWVDFPEEDIEFASKDELLSKLSHILSDMEKLHLSFHSGKVLSSSISMCIAGTPNVGKSTLMNLLCKKQRAIVTSIPGTTRDILEDNIEFADLLFHVQDTAGIRETDQIIEKEGIKRSKKAIEDSDIVLLVLDSTKKISNDEQKLLHFCKNKKTVIIWNKIDIEKPTQKLDNNHIIEMSAKNDIGLQDLEKAIKDLLFGNNLPSKQEVIITNFRHKQALSEAIENIHLARVNLEKNVSPEFIASDLKSALICLSSVIGTNVTEDILSKVFSKFCIGK